MSTPAIGDILLYTPTADEKTMTGFTGSTWPAITVEVYGDGDATLLIFGCPDGGGGAPMTASACFKRCNEGAGEGEWAVKP